MTFTEILAAIYSDLNYESSPPAAVVTRVKRWVNHGHKTLLRHPGLTKLRQGTVSFASVASQAVYGLPQAFDRVDAIVQQSNDARLVNRTLDWLRSVDPGERMSGNPEAWVDFGWQPALMQPTSDGIWAVSTSASDVQSVYVQGIRANGDIAGQITTTMTGTSRVQLGTFTDYVRILSWSLSSAAVGAVSLYDASSSGNELARIPIGATDVKYQSIRLWPTPAAALTYYVDGQFEVSDLVQSNDVPLIPPIFHDLLVAYGTLREAEKMGNTNLYMIAKQDWDRDYQRLVNSVEFPSDYRPIASSLSGNVGVNDLGSWYPADFWI